MNTIAADPYADVRDAVRRRLGSDATIANVVTPTLGGINRTLAFDVVEGNSRRRMVSRQETHSGQDDLFLAASDQFRILKLVHAHGLPVAEPLFEYDERDGMGHGYVTLFVEGETVPRLLQRSPKFEVARGRFAAQCGQLLARLHAIEPAEFDFLRARADSHDAIDAFRSRYDQYGEARPALEAGFRWLERHRKHDVQKRFLHGDFRCGNLMITPDGVSAVLDWECSHLGAPMEDLAWLCTRSWRFDRPDLPVGGIGTRADFYQAYEAASGSRVDHSEVLFWEVFGLVRSAVYNIWQAHDHLTGQRRSVAYAACGRNTALVEYDLLMTLAGRYD